MIIISKYNDYYDNAIAYGVDKSIVYMRKQKEIEFKDSDCIRKRLLNIIGDENNISYRIGNDTIRPFFIGFCGKIYRGYSYSPYSRNINRSNNVYGFDKASFPEYIMHEKAREEYSFVRKNNTSFEKILLGNIFVKEDVKFFQDNKLVSFFFEDGYNSTYIINPILSDFNFQQIVEGEDAFQKISTFISSVLRCNEEEVVKIVDGNKIISHSFDD